MLMTVIRLICGRAFINKQTKNKTATFLKLNKLIKKAAQWWGRNVKIVENADHATVW